VHRSTVAQVLAGFVPGSSEEAFATSPSVRTAALRALNVKGPARRTPSAAIIPKVITSPAPRTVLRMEAMSAVNLGMLQR
jgi:hypothetical protein